jgi:hypothetical protein
VRLAATALDDVILDTVGRAVERLERQSIDRDAEAFADRLQTTGLDEDLINEAVVRRKERERKRHGSRPGRKGSQHADAIYLLNYALNNRKDDLTARERHELIARIATDFFGATTAEDVRQLVKDGRRRDRARRPDGRHPVAAFLSKSETLLGALDRLPRTPVEHRRSRHDSGARGYMYLDGLEPSAADKLVAKALKKRG